MSDASRPPLDDARAAFALAALLLAVELIARVGRDDAGRDGVVAPAAAARHLVDVNSAPAGEIDALPGVGRVLADRIVAARASIPFASVDDLGRVPGVGRATIERLRPFARTRSDE